jgi:hypothetical protein
LHKHANRWKLLIPARIGFGARSQKLLPSTFGYDDNSVTFLGKALLEMRQASVVTLQLNWYLRWGWIQNRSQSMGKKRPIKKFRRVDNQLINQASKLSGGIDNDKSVLTSGTRHKSTSPDAIVANAAMNLISKQSERMYQKNNSKSKIKNKKIEFERAEG